MEALTFAISMIVSIAVFFVQPVHGLILYLASFIWYPSFLTVSVGTIDFTVRRIVVIAILFRLLLQEDTVRSFRLILLDKLVVLYFVAELIAGTMTASSVMAMVENRGGAMFDMVLPYFAVRLAIRTRQQYVQLLKGILVISGPLAIAGLGECLTGWNPLGFLQLYQGPQAGQTYYAAAQRFGLSRATITFSHSIMFGLYFAVLGPACAGIYYSIKNRMLFWFAMFLMGVGVFASVSSGPVLATLAALALMGFYRWRRYWKVAVATVILMCGSVEIISNRHFYDVLGRYTLSSETAWYRSRLIDVALFEGGMSGHWLSGYGYDVDPGWGPKIDGRAATDTVNHYILELHRFGLIGLGAFVAMGIAAAKRLRQGYLLSTLDSDRWLVWCVAGALFGLSATMMTVSLFGPPTTIFFMLLGFAGLMPRVLGEQVRSRMNLAPATRSRVTGAIQTSIHY
jgi:hypothetical protein